MQRPDPLIPSKPGAEDIEVMKARTLWLEEFFPRWPRPQVAPHARPVYGIDPEIPAAAID